MLTTSMFRTETMRWPVAVEFELNRKVSVMLNPIRLLISKHSSVLPHGRGGPPIEAVELLPEKVPVVPVWFNGLETLVMIFVEFDTR